jgi:TPP-dependent pyruvate/acetoin dehydrogenase alpha subunit
MWGIQRVSKEEQAMDQARLTDLYEQMLRVMLWEQKQLRLIDEGKVSGFYHSGRGQEAVPVGGCAELREDDYLLYAHRGCGYMIAKGLSMSKLFGDFLANTEGTTRGLGAGIVHIAWPDLGILGQSGTLGGAFPIAAGAALSAKYRGTDQVVMCFFGEATQNRGTFHESLNVMALWKLPVVLICENNLWAVSVSAAESTCVEDVADRAKGYGIPGKVIDGMDVVAVYEAATEAVERARSGEGPTLIEAKTYRFRGHYEGDPASYREKRDLEEWQKRDPILTLAKRLSDEGVDVEEIQAKVQREVDEALEVAEKAPMPGRERLFEGVYA